MKTDKKIYQLFNAIKRFLETNLYFNLNNMNRLSLPPSFWKENRLDQEFIILNAIHLIGEKKIGKLCKLENIKDNNIKILIKSLIYDDNIYEPFPHFNSFKR